MKENDVKALFGENVEVYQKFKETFDKMPKVVALRQQASNLQRAFRYVQAMQIEQKIAEIEYQAAKNLLAEQEVKAQKVSLVTQGLPKADIDLIVRLSIGLDVCCDVTETYLMDIDDTLKRTNKDLSYEEFFSVRDALKEVRGRLSRLAKISNYRNYDVWGDECDKAAKYLLTKVKKIMQETARIEASSKPKTEKP